MVESNKILIQKVFSNSKKETSKLKLIHGSYIGFEIVSEFILYRCKMQLK